MKKIVIVFYSLMSLGFFFIFSGCSKTEPISMAPSTDTASVTVSPEPDKSFSATPTFSISTQDPFARVRFTTNGSEPTLAEGMDYTNQFSLPLSLSAIPLQARAYNKDGLPGKLFSNSYIIRPVVFWKLDEGVGLSAYDQSVNGYTGTLGSATGITWVAGKSGTACFFTRVAGVAYQIGAGTATMCNFTDNFTLSAWVKPNALTNTGMILGKDSYPANGYRFYIVATSGFPRLMTLNGAATSFNGTTGVTTGVWSHVAVTFSYPNIRFYVNGVLAGTATTAQSITEPTASGIHINSSYSPEMFDGAIDNVRVYATVLTDSHISALYTLEN